MSVVLPYIPCLLALTSQTQLYDYVRFDWMFECAMPVVSAVHCVGVHCIQSLNGGGSLSHAQVTLQYTAHCVSVVLLMLGKLWNEVRLS